MPLGTLDSADLRRAFSSFATGVTVVTTRSSSAEAVGFTANSFSSVSLDPPMLLVCIAKGIRCYPVFSSAASFAVNILAEDQKEVSSTFASRGADKFGTVKWTEGRTGSPRLDGVVAWFDCQMQQMVPAGDHSILIGRIVEYRYDNRAPLGFCGGAYLSFGLLQDAAEVAHRDGRVRVGAVLECDGAVLLEEDLRTHTLAVPTAAHLGSAPEHSGLYGKLAEWGYAITLPFLFSVYEDGKTQFVIHRGNAIRRGECRGASTIRLFSIDAIPWARIASPAERLMLERYQRERATNVTGIYVGTAESGDLHTVMSSQPL
jgi:flavin reductase (DIM6/NTAB) family NADH-FMN oxidoreductase RutF